MPFLRRTALARSRCFSGSQRARVSGVFPTPPCLPNAKNPLSPNIFSGGGSKCPSEVAPVELRSPPGGHGSPPRQRRPSGRTHAAWPEWKVRASPCTGPASPQPPGSAPPPGVLCGHFAQRAPPQLLPRGPEPRRAQVLGLKPAPRAHWAPRSPWPGHALPICRAQLCG